jgi:hypothetical protein
VNNHISDFIAAHHGTPGSDDFARAESKEQFFRQLGESLVVWAAEGKGPTVDLCTTALIAAFNFGFAEALGPVDLDARINLDDLPDIGAALDESPRPEPVKMVRAEAVRVGSFHDQADAKATAMWLSLEGPDIGPMPIGVQMTQAMADGVIELLVSTRLSVWGEG